MLQAFFKQYVNKKTVPYALHLPAFPETAGSFSMCLLPNHPQFPLSATQFSLLKVETFRQLRSQPCRLK